MRGAHGLPGRAQALLAAAVAGGVGIIAWRATEIGTWEARDLAAFVVLTAAVTVAELFPISLRFQEEIEDFLMTDVVFAVGLFLVPSAVLTLAVAAGIGLGNAIRRTAVHKTLFNVGQDVVAITAALAVFHTFGRTSPLEPVAWVGAGLGMATYFAFNEASLAGIISMVEGTSFLSVLTRPIGLSLMQFGGNLAIGVMGAALWRLSPRLLPLLAAPLLLAFLAYRASLHSMQERDRMRNLYEAGRALLGPLEATADFRSFLPLAERMLNAAAVEVVVLEDGEVTVYGADETVALALAPVGRPGSRPEVYVRARPGLFAHTAEFETGASRGVLAVYRTEALTPAERSLADTLASQIAVKLQNRRLFSETVDQRRQLSNIIGSASDGIFVLGQDLRIRSWNPAMERITALSEENVVGRTWDEVFGTALEVGTGTYGEPHDALIERPDGDARWMRYVASPLSDRTDGPEGMVVVARDVTAELEAEQLQTDFVATVSHELRTPLTPLKGYLAALTEGTIDSGPEARAEYYRVMLKQTERLERLVNDLLEAASLQGGRVSLERQAVELTSLVSAVVDEHQLQDQGRPFQLRTPGVPVSVTADPFRVQQVLGNLLSNALKYSPRGTLVEVSVDVGVNDATVSVRDHGPGIPSAEQDRIFDRFHRGEIGLVRRTGGTGLGLYIAKRLVQSMGGQLWLVSRPGAGATFSFKLPMEPQVQAGAVAGTVELAASGNGAGRGF